MYIFQELIIWCRYTTTADDGMATIACSSVSSGLTNLQMIQTLCLSVSSQTPTNHITADVHQNLTKSASAGGGGVIPNQFDPLITELLSATSEEPTFSELLQLFNEKSNYTVCIRFIRIMFR